MEEWHSGGRAAQRKWWLLVVCCTAQDPGDSSQKVPPSSFNQLLPTSTWCYLSHFQWRCFLRWGWYTSWHSCGRAGIFWWRWQCWGSHPSPAEKEHKGESPFSQGFENCSWICISGCLKSFIVFGHIFSSSFLLAPILPYTSHSLAPFPAHCFSTLAPGNFTPHSPYSSLCSCSFLNPSCMMPELWPSGETNHLFNIKCPQRLPVEVCWLDLVRTQLQCFRNDHKFIVS